MKKKLSLFLIIIFLIFTLSACNFKADGYYGYKDLSYGAAEREKLDLYIPDGVSGDAGLLLLIHGGAWSAGDKSGYEDTLKYWVNKGYVCAAINYRYASYYVHCDDMMDDITSALNKIKNKAKKAGINLTKVVLSGGSAGAHMSLLYAYKYYNESPITPTAVISYSGPTDLTLEDYYTSQYADKIVVMFTKLTGKEITESNYTNYLKDLKEVSPLYYANENSVPTIILQGAKDDVVSINNGNALADKLSALNVEYEYLVYPNSGHGLESDQDMTIKAETLVEEYINKYLN